MAIEKETKKTKKEEKKEIKEIREVEEKEKSFFFPRFVAYIIDIVLIFVLSAVLLGSIPTNKNHERYVEEYKQIQQDYKDKKIKEKEYVNKSKDIVYDIDYTNSIVALGQIAILIGYFVILQYFLKGQTIGKKIMKIKVISVKDGDLNLNQLTLRSLIANSILVNLLLVIAVLFIGRDYYYYASMILQFLDSAIIMAIILMIIFKKDKRGLHDILTGTKVVSSVDGD